MWKTLPQGFVRQEGITQEVILGQMQTSRGREEVTDSPSIALDHRTHIIGMIHSMYLK